MGMKDIVILEPPLVTISDYHYLNKKKQHLLLPLTEALRQMEKEGLIQKIQMEVEKSALSRSER